MRGLDRGESYIVTRNGVPVGELMPVRRHEAVRAEMLLAGLPQNITLGNLTGLPASSTMITSYLCLSYQLRPMSSFLANIFIGTATMLLSAWAAWTFVTAFIAERIKGPCK